MDFRNLTKLLIKLMGAFVIVQTLSYWPAYLAPAMELLGASPGYFAGAAFGPIVLPMIGGAFLFLLPGRVTNIILTTSEPSDSHLPDLKKIERVLLSVLGVYLALRAMADLVFGVAKILGMHLKLAEQMPNLPLAPNVYADLYGSIIASSVELIFGVFLIAGVAGVQALLARLRGSDSF